MRRRFRRHFRKAKNSRQVPQRPTYLKVHRPLFWRPSMTVAAQTPDDQGAVFDNLCEKFSSNLFFKGLKEEKFKLYCE